MLQGMKCYPVLQCYKVLFSSVLQSFFLQCGEVLSVLLLGFCIFLKEDSIWPHMQERGESLQFFAKGNKRLEQTMQIQKGESSQERLTVLTL